MSIVILIVSFVGARDHNQNPLLNQPLFPVRTNKFGSELKENSDSRPIVPLKLSLRLNFVN